MKSNSLRTQKRSARGIQIFLLVVAVILCVCAYYIRQNRPLPDGTLEMYFLDVGQGDATLIATEAGCLLIDTGESSEQEHLYLSASIYGDTLKYLILTHPHADHTGGALYILSKMDIETVILPRDFFENGENTRLLEAIIDEGAAIRFADVGTEFSLGEAKFTVLAPTESYAETNNMSIVLRMDFGLVSAIFTGDAEVESELDQIAYWGGFPDGTLDADILKIGHHGSATSSSMEYLTAVSPAVAVISCGENNSYGHPAAATLDRLAEIGAEVFRTDQRGTIQLNTDGSTVTLQEK